MEGPSPDEVLQFSFLRFDPSTLMPKPEPSLEEKLIKSDVIIEVDDIIQPVFVIEMIFD
jgi:hypothetical protein